MTTSPFQHPSGLAGAYDRTPLKPLWDALVFREGNFAQAAELNEMASLIGNRGRRISDRIMRDGDRVSGADIIVDTTTGAVTLTAGQVYVRGDIRQVADATLTGVSMTGSVIVGVRVVTTYTTEVDDPDMLGLAPGTDAEGEPGAARQIATVVWGWDGDGQTGDLFQVYLLQDGVAVDQSAPPELEGVTQAIASYDMDAHGSYIVRGCAVTALGRISGAQHFSIAEGVANILGFKRTRNSALRHIEPEVFDTAAVDAEPHTFADGGSGTAVIPINHGPLAAVSVAIVERLTTATITKGIAGGADPLPNSSVTQIVSVTQGATTYVAGTDFALNADKVDWSPGGAEPAPGSTYSVQYRYLDAVTPTATTDDSVTLTGGVTGGQVFLSYTWKLPRTDLLCLDSNGLPVYVKGLSSAVTPKAPSAPSQLLALCEVQNDWRGTATVVNTDVRSVPFIELWAYLRRLFDALDLIALERLKRDIDSREPVAKKGVFVDPWIDDTYRDAGVAQTAAVFDGQMQLAIADTTYALTLPQHALLDYTEEVILRQDLATSCMKVNPYKAFTPIPAAMTLSPAVDYWTDFETQWASAVTRVIFGGEVGTSSAITQTVSSAVQVLEYLRPIGVGFTINGFAPGEALTALTFDGLDVMPAGLVADANGQITGTFTIPGPNTVLAGTKIVAATGAAGTTAAAKFSGQGQIDIDTLRQVTTISREKQNGQDHVDPLAQTFALTEGRFVTGFDLQFCAIGDRTNPVIVEIHPVESGWPTEEVLAQAVIPMASALTGVWTAARFPLPVYLQANRQYAVMVKTDDDTHALSTARVGDYDAVNKRYVGSQAYAVGVLLSSSNAVTWTAHQDQDLTFRIVGATFAPTSKTVELGTAALSNISDLLVNAGVELATDAASCVFEIERATGDKTRVLAGQPWAMTGFLTETVKVRAILSGSDKITPILYPNPLLIGGTLQASGTYVTRAFDMGASIRMSAIVKTNLPAGSALTVEIDADDGAWASVPQYAATILSDGTTEREYRIDPYTATTGRLRLTLSGTPGARPVLTDMRAVAI